MQAGDPSGRKVPRQAGPSRRGSRSCIGCRARNEREALVRIVCSPEGEVVVDRYLKAPGLCVKTGRYLLKNLKVHCWLTGAQLDK